MKILSLCSGYGGLDMAVENHFSAKTAYWSDVDETACAVMEARFPDAEPVGDLTELDDRKFDCSMLVAGYPCQPYSQAGKLLGENDERNLWPYIANTIGVSRPQWVILENVSNHVNIGGPAVIASLASMGYSDIRWGVIPASAALAPHKRKRLFIVANTEGAEWESAQHEHMGASFRSAPESRERPSAIGWGKYGPVIRRWERVLGRPAPDPITDGKLSAVFVEWLMGLPFQGFVTDVAASRAKALACLGNGVVPQQAALALELLT